MPKVTDFYVTNEVVDIMEKIIDTFPQYFSNFNTSLVQTVFTKKKKSANNKVFKVHAVRYPVSVCADDKTYVVEMFDENWKKLPENKKYLQVFRMMLYIPEGGFDVTSKQYGKIKKPDIDLFMRELEVTKDPNWQEADAVPNILEKALKAARATT